MQSIQAINYRLYTMSNLKSDNSLNDQHLGGEDESVDYASNTGIVHKSDDERGWSSNKKARFMRLVFPWLHAPLLTAIHCTQCKQFIITNFLINYHLYSMANVFCSPLFLHVCVSICT